MEATRYDYAWLQVEGAIFQSKRRYPIGFSKRGWYYKDEFIGYNADEAIRRLRVIKGYDK
jgi:hypothetical protein